MTHEDEALNHEREALDHELGTQYDDLTEPERYDTATDDWQSPEQRKFQKLLADYRKSHPEEFCRESMLTTKPARRWQQAKDERRTPKTELFGPMWRTGELAVLFGETGAGKSILAVQIAESISRGNAVQPFRTPQSALRTQSVLYLDLAHSAEQFDERYSCPSPILGKLPVRYRFSPKLRRASFGDLEIPEAFRGNHRRYFMHSLNLALEETGATVLIIDNLSWFDTSASGAASAARTLRDLKFFSLTTGASVLVLHNSPPCLGRVESSSPPARGGVDALRGRGGGSRGGSLKLRIPRSAFRIYEPADSVFAIAHSRFFPEMRYVKNLKSNYVTPEAETRPVGSMSLSVPQSALRTPQSGEVLTYCIERTAGFVRTENGSDRALSNPHSAGSPPYEGGVAAATPLLPEERWTRSGRGGGSDGVVLSSSNPHSALRIPQSEPATPFLGLTYVGLSTEADHYRDLEREFQNAKRVQNRRVLRSSKEILVDGILDGSYGRFLKGE